MNEFIILPADISGNLTICHKEVRYSLVVFLFVLSQEGLALMIVIRDVVGCPLRIFLPGRFGNEKIWPQVVFRHF